MVLIRLVNFMANERITMFGTKDELMVYFFLIIQIFDSCIASNQNLLFIKERKKQTVGLRANRFARCLYSGTTIAIKEHCFH